MNKSGISAVVAMVLIILITVALVALLWSIIIPLINAQLQFAEDCRKASVSLKVESACTTIENITFIIARGSEDFELVDLQFGGGNRRDMITDGYLSEIVNIFSFGGPSLPKLNEKRKYSFNITDKLTPKVTRMRVAPVIKHKSRRHTCDPSSWTVVPWCWDNLTKAFPKVDP